MKKNNMLKTAILSVSFLLMLRLTISPALAEIGKAFPAIAQGTLMMMVALPSLIAIPFGLVSGLVAHLLRKKVILYAGLAFFILGGIGPMFVSDFGAILLLRCFLGAGTGLFLPLATGLIADFFSGDERNSMIGFQSTAVAVGNIVTSMLAGALAVVSYKLSFLIYAFGFVTLGLVALRMPEPPRPAAARGGKGMRLMNGRMLFIAVAIFCYAVIYFSIFGYLAFMIDSSRLGDAASTGFATMLMTIASVIMGIVFSRLAGLLKRYSLLVALLANILGFYLLSRAGALPQVFAGTFVIGLGFGFLMPYATMRITDAAPEGAATFANGLFMTFVNIGTAVSPVILVAVGRLFRNPDARFIYLFCAICLGAAALASLVAALIPAKAKKS